MTVAQINSGPSELDNVTVDYAAVLRHLGLNGNDARSQAVVLVCKRYDLDPVLKHVVLVEGNVYVTRDGLLHVAHGTGQLDGLEVEEAKLSEDGKEWRSRAAVYRKDMSRPIALSGRFPAGRKNSPEMAEKVAVARALKHAFSVAIATDDERQAQETTTYAPAAPVTASEIIGSKPQVIDAEATPLITAAQMKRLHTSMTDAGLTDREQGLAFLGAVIGRDIDTSKALSKDEATRVIDELERLNTAEAATDQGDEPEEPPSDVEALWPETAQPGGGA